MASSVISDQPNDVKKEDSTSEDWMDSFGPPKVIPEQGISQTMNQGVGSFPGFGANFGQFQPSGNNMFQSNAAFFPSSNLPVEQG
eukprot:TRINITY_DN7138_c0_g1_i1.p1 TRINITY_DN7138_c0_g1~~TRINITY_DN7138_c0_g1_i1.p1  ORF type:complete len:85 (-),score=15.88 TRINITY_DN7138_c0_g1_i1:104-358(-)